MLGENHKSQLVSGVGFVHQASSDEGCERWSQAIRWWTAMDACGEGKIGVPAARRAIERSS